MYSPARSAVSVESEDGWVVWFSAEAPDGKPRRARPPRAPAPKLTVPKPVHQDGGMGQTLGELAAALADALGRRDAALSERDAAVAERDAAVAALAAAKKPANGHAATKRRSPAKTPPRSQKASKPSPAAVSRFRLDRLRNDFCPSPDDPDEFSFNVWSSGLWVSTPTGATGVMASAGGDMGVDVNSRDLQYLVREHLVGENDDVAFVRDKSHGFVDEEHHLKVRWNSQHGRVYIDGHHTAFDLELGDQVLVSSHAAPLRIFSNVV